MKNISFRNDVLPLKNVLYRLALRITLSREEAEDIVQDTLIKVWNRRDDWQSIDSVEAYSITVCRNLALDAIKKRDNNNESLDQRVVETPDQASNPHELMIKKDRVEMVRQLVNRLPEKQRSCLQLRDFEGKTYKEIAEMLEVTEEQVKVNIFRARQSIRQQFDKADKYGL
ncbi:MAG: RNA polymerase sigma factor [Prevotella sp.]|uniref:RNA polymerase sigma factor n=1 Tax=Prevotella sp. TaxID=59823 RepID=UPI002A293603|nr:RNA polymerase sigma factor [Prevotella sp.]MDD7317207.1 RNA polymerase sigma factor [Prevotellaceae bacterium]MDY4019811.1 RNA polymerase sigma factor [Prevotella sp.]